MGLSKELNDSEAESKACFNLGYVHFNLGNYTEAVRYYEQDLAFEWKQIFFEEGTERELLGDVVHGFRQVTNIARGDSSHGNSSILNKSMLRNEQ